jgi:hypothetical protein
VIKNFSGGMMGLVITIIMILVFFSITASERVAMCKFCNSTNWSGITCGDITMNCSKISYEERNDCRLTLSGEHFT